MWVDCRGSLGTVYSVQVPGVDQTVVKLQRHTGLYTNTVDSSVPGASRARGSKYTLSTTLVSAEQSDIQIMLCCQGNKHNRHKFEQMNTKVRTSYTPATDNT